MTSPEATTPATIALSDAIARYSHERGVDLATIAQLARISPERLELLAEGEAFLVEPESVEGVARALELPADRLREYRLVVVRDSLAGTPDRLDALFLEALSPVERKAARAVRLSNEPLGPTVSRLLAERGLTPEALAAGAGLDQLTFSRLMNGRERLSSEVLDAFARALDTARETFLEYRLAAVEGWLREQPARADQLFAELDWQPTLADYRAWPVRTLPDPLETPPRALIESLLEIIRTEGPVMADRVHELRLAAAELTETRELRSILDRAVGAAARAGLVVADDEREEQTQKQHVLRLPDQPSVVPRTLGGRQLWQVPLRELDAVMTGMSAWKQGGGVTRVQTAIMAVYGLPRGSAKDAEHINRCIMRARREGDQ